MFEDFDQEMDNDDNDDDAPASRAEPEGLKPPRENPDCLGHEANEAMLLQLIGQSRLPHAMIFAGQQGIGKATMAYRLARYILQGGGNADAEPAGLFGAPLPKAEPASLFVAPDAPVFRQVASGGHADLMTVERPYDDKKDRHKDSVDIETVRKIAPFMRMTASKDGGWRVVIVDDADTMTRQAQNGILKILEEPPQRAILILVCHRPGALIPTIRSRCRLVPFQPLALPVFSTLARKLDPGLDRDSLTSLHSLTEGSIGQAQNLIEEGGLETLAKLTGLLAGFPSWNWEAIHALADSLHDPGGLVAEQERIGVVDAAITVGEVGVADPAGVNGDDDLTRPGVGDDDVDEFDLLALSSGDDAAHDLTHAVRP